MRSYWSPLKILIEQVTDHCWALFVALVSNGYVEAFCELKVLSLCGRQNSPKSDFSDLSSKNMYTYLHFLSDPLDWYLLMLRT